MFTQKPERQPLEKPKRPKRPYKNFEAYMQDRRGLMWNQDIEWPCPECRAHGRIYDPRDPRCPVEGNKNRNTITCPRCRGTRSVEKELYKKWYAGHLAKWKKEVEEYHKTKALFESGMVKLEAAKLTEEEMVALGLVPSKKK